MIIRNRNRKQKETRILIIIANHLERETDQTETMIHRNTLWIIMIIEAANARVLRAYVIYMMFVLTVLPFPNSDIFPTQRIDDVICFCTFCEPQNQNVSLGNLQNVNINDVSGHVTIRSGDINNVHHYSESKAEEIHSITKPSWLAVDDLLKAKILFNKHRDAIAISGAIQHQTLEEVLEREFRSVRNATDYIDRIVQQIEVRSL